MSAIADAATLAARLMDESHFNQHDPAFREAYFQRTGDRHASVAPHIAARDALALIQIGKGVARRAVQCCNGIPRWNAKHKQVLNDWTEADEARRERLDGKAAGAANAILARYGATVKLGGDPRGYVMRVFFRSEALQGRAVADDGWGVV